MSKKCKISDDRNHVIPCKDLLRSVEDKTPPGKRKGIYMWAYSNTQTHERTRTFFGAKSGRHIDSGIAFNYCPFCGVEITSPFVKEDVK